MDRQEMLTDIIRTYGFENPVTLRFARYCEEFKTDRVVQAAYNIIKEIYSPFEEDEE